MEAGFIVALALGIPIVLFPVALVWYLQVGGILAAVRERRVKRVAKRTAKVAIK